MFEIFGRVVERALFKSLRADSRMRADHHALATLNAEVWLPDGNILRDVALLPLRCADRVSSVQRKRAHWKLIATTRDNFRRDVLHKLRCDLRHGCGDVELARRLLWNRDFKEMCERRVHRREVLFDNSLAAFTVSFFD